MLYSRAQGEPLAGTGAAGAYGLRYSVDGDLVILDGKLFDGTGEGVVAETALTVIPEAARPAARLVFARPAQKTGNQSVRVDVLPSGEVVLAGPAEDFEDTWLTGMAFSPTVGDPLALPEGIQPAAGFSAPEVIRRGDIIALSGVLAPTGDAMAKGTTVATLAEADRLAKRLVFVVAQEGGTARVDVLPDGRLLYVDGAPGATWLSLSGIVFAN